MKKVIKEQALDIDAILRAMASSNYILKSVGNSIENSRKGNLER